MDHRCFVKYAKLNGVEISDFQNLFSSIYEKIDLVWDGEFGTAKNKESFHHFDANLFDHMECLFRNEFVPQSSAQHLISKKRKLETTVEMFLAGEIRDPEILELIEKNISKVSILIKDLCWRFQPQPPESLLQIPKIKDTNLGMENIDPSLSDIARGKFIFPFISFSSANIIKFPQINPIIVLFSANKPNY